MSDMEINKLLERYKSAKGRQTNWRDNYREAVEYTLPERETFDEWTKGEKKDGAGEVFDSTAKNATAKFVSNIQSSLVPPFKKWINLEAGAEIPDSQKPAANKQLEEVTDLMFSVIQNSSFDIMSAESFFDLAIGTGVLLVTRGEGDSPIRFTSVPLSQIYLEEGASGRADEVYREHSVPVRAIPEMWEDAKLTEQMREDIELKPNKSVRLLEATVPSKITVYDINTDSDVEVNGYIYYVLDRKTKEVLVRREQESSPWIVFRWSTLPGEVYGRGPVLNALPDIKTLNKTKELILKNASLAVAGAWTAVDDGIVNIDNIQIQPGAIIPVSSNGGGISGATLAPLQTGSRFDVGQIIVNDLKMAINEALFAEPLGPVNLPVKTATEVAFRQQELAKRIGSSFGRLQYEFITPLVNRILYLLEEQGLIDLQSFRVDGRIIAIKNQSPLASSQGLEEFMSMTRWMEFVTNAYGQQANLLLTDPQKVIELAGGSLDVPKDIMPDPERYEEIRQMLQQIFANQQQV